MGDLEKQIVTILTTDSALTTLLGASGRVYPEMNAKFEVFPCVTYHLLDSVENSVPRTTQDSEVSIHAYCRLDKDTLEKIVSRINILMRYQNVASPRLYWSKKISEFQANEKDRQMYHKVLRYRFWTSII